MKKFQLLATILILLYSYCARETVTDADGNSYSTVKIGNQIWTVENLRTTKFNDGTSIPHVPDSVEWLFLDSPGYCFYGNTNDADTIKKLGALYNWYCVDSKILAPQGWHVPTNEDWKTLQNYLIEHGYNWHRRKSGNEIAKSLAAQSGWKPFTIEGTPGNTMRDNNRSGFSGFAAGYRLSSQITTECSDARSIFKAITHKGAWWSATEINELEAFSYGLGYCCESLIEYDAFEKSCGYSVRLIKNTE